MFFSDRIVGLFATLTVVLLAFWPAPFGSFPATHGPVTALRVLSDVLLLLFVISNLPIAGKAVLFSVHWRQIDARFPDSLAPIFSRALRC